MSVKMVREPSSEPNIQNLDDFIGLRYAYGNQNGYCVGKGSELSYSVSGSTFKILSGRIVVQGVECDIDANGVSIQIDNIASRRYHSIYLQVSLSTMTVSVLEMYDTASYPVISAGDDLNENTIGTAQIELYRFSSLNGAISDISKVIKPMQYAYQQISELQSNLTDGSVQVKIAQYASSDLTKGTIEQRLNQLGFRQGSISLINGGTAQLKRQGNYTIVYIRLFSGNTSETTSPWYQGGTIGTIPVNFRPLRSFSSDFGGEAIYYVPGNLPSNPYIQVTALSRLTIYPSGLMQITQPKCEFPFGISTMTQNSINCRFISVDITVGFESSPIKAN